MTNASTLFIAIMAANVLTASERDVTSANDHQDTSAWNQPVDSEKT